MNTFGVNRPVYSFGLGLVLTLIDPGLPPDTIDNIFYPTDCRNYVATECSRTYIPTDKRRFETE